EEAEELASRQRGLDGRDAVQEPRLVGVSDRLGVDQRGDPDDRYPVGRVELGHRSQDRGLTVPEVRAETDECPGHAGDGSYAWRTRGAPHPRRRAAGSVRV